MKIKTKRFILRPLRISDSKAYFETMQDKETQKSLNSTPKNLKETKKEIRKFLKQVKQKDSHYFTIEVRGKYAGNVILQHQNYDPKCKDGRMHLWIHPKFRGKGLATQALNELIKFGFKKKGFKRIFTQCKSTNKGVIKINKKLGFKKVKTHINEFGIKKILFVKNKPCNKCNLKSDLILKKYPHWTAMISNSLTPIGWIYIILKRHVEHFDELTNTELIELKKIIKQLRKALIKAFDPDWSNIMQLGNGGRHMHIHLVPRYKGKIKFGGKSFSDPDYGNMLKDRYKPYKDKKLLLKLRDYIKRNLR